eukprot:Gregarina_sp_Poly_1__1909@NODE_149_length_12634_cov_195_682741_g133_i0_p3_GENE_NODE_149_length_12634_cov_195_682741_g133_i0NODE_149_length_12634_cov_195_682741_g133_i0_p3_ORF_typecomplete_len533_score53_50DUF3482/PF11981_8/3_1e02DUF3482/PF11981_8/0_13_NODE_149_length_12634_cov_195_682741_g133_i070848682
MRGNVRSDTQTTSGSSQHARRRARAGAVGGSQYGTAVSSQHSESQTPTNRLGTGDRDFEVVEESIPPKKIIMPYMLMHPRVIPRLLLQSIAGSYWVQVRTQIRFFPLRFIQMSVEQDYRKILNKTYQIRLPIGMALLSYSSLLSWVLLGVGHAKDWVHLEDAPHVWRVFHATSSLATIFSLFCCCTPFLSWTARHSEWWFYICGGINNTAWLAWACWAVVEAEPDMSKATSPEHAAEIIRVFFELKMVVDALTIGILISTLVNTDIFLHTLSSRSLYFHLYTWALFITSRLSQNRSLPDNKMKVTNGIDAGLCFILYLVGWGCRWFRELQDRAVVIRVRESQAKLNRVREAQKTRRRRRDQSAAEEIIDLLNQCKGTVIDTKTLWQKSSRTPGSTDILDEAENVLLECIKTLATGADNMGQVRRVATADSKDTEELEEDAFIEMYKINRVIVQKADDPNAQRKARGGTRNRSQGTVEGVLKKVTIKGQEQIQYKMKYCGLDFPGLSLLDVFQASVGKDYGLRLLDVRVLAVE